MRNQIRTLQRVATIVVAGCGVCASLQAAEVSGYLKREGYSLPAGANTIDFFISNPKYPNSPDWVTYVDTFASPQTANPNVENYGGRITGFITPATTDNYVFFVSSDDPGAFYLSTDENPANKKLIAQETVWSNALQWQTSGGASSLANKRSDQFTGTEWPGGATVRLEAGKKYYAELLWKEGGGGDNGGVTMYPASQVVTNPDDPFAGVPAEGEASTLTGSLISTEAPTALGFLKQPESQTIQENRPVTFSVIAVTPPGNPVQDPTLLVPDVTYQWRRNGVDIPIADEDFDGFPDPGSSGTANYTIPSAPMSDNGAKFTCRITTSGGQTATSAEATLTVSDDTQAPTISLVTGSPTFDSVTVVFSEAMNPAGLDSTGNYSLSGGLTVNAVTIQSPTKVVLTTSEQPKDSPFTLTVNSGSDIAGNALVEKTYAFRTFKFIAGAVYYERYENVTAGLQAWIDAGGPAQAPPTASAVLTTFDAPTGVADNYVGRLFGWFTPAQSGAHVFFCSSDDQGFLFLSTDDDPSKKVKIATEPQWNDQRDWATADRRNAEALENRSDTWQETEWSTGVGGDINLTAGTQYYLEFLFKEGGGGDNGAATFILKGGATPADQAATALTGNVIGTYVDPSTLPPIITQRPVGKHFSKGESITLTVTAESAHPMTYQWFQNKKPIAGATAATLAINNADVNAVGDYLVEVSNKNGMVSSYPDDNVRLLMTGAFVIELEDYNFGSGQTVAEASTMPLAPNLYLGKDGAPGIDFHIVAASQVNGVDALANENGNSYRNGWVNNGTTVDFPTSPEPLGNVDVTGNDGDRDRGDFTIATNYKLGWNSPGEWYQYTRSFPAGNYNVLLGTSLDGRAADAISDTLELVTGDPTKVNPATTVLGTILGNGTGAWSSNDLLGYRNPDGSLATITLGANTTLRVRNSGSGDHDLDYLLLYPAAVTGPTLTSTYVGGVLTLTYTGTLESSATLNGDFTDVAGATSPYTVPQVDAARYFRSHD